MAKNQIEYLMTCDQLDDLIGLPTGTCWRYWIEELAPSPERFGKEPRWGGKSFPKWLWFLTYRTPIGFDRPPLARATEAKIEPAA